MEKALTYELIQQKTKCDNLSSLKKLNLWGNDLCDLSILYKMPNIEILSLSLNQIRSLKYFANCKKLKELFVRKNFIADIQELNYLRDLPSLNNLWLSENPCATIPNYRLICIKFLPQLTKLDNEFISNEERAAAQGINLDSIFNQNDEQYVTLQYSQDQSVQQSQQFYEQNHSQPNQQYNNQFAFPQGSTVLSQKQLTCFQKPTATNVYSKEEEERNENILCAVLSLVKELDETSLEILKKNVDKRLAQMREQQQYQQ